MRDIVTPEQIAAPVSPKGWRDDGRWETATNSTGGAGRLPVLDGLRGTAAFVVIIYHYLCLAHPRLTPSMSEAPNAIVDTPINLAVNGAFAVAIFFVLSGFVIARSADRRRETVMRALVARYLRLALPAAASCLLAWALLTMLPNATSELRNDPEFSSRWLEYTYQGDIGSPVRAVYNGMIGIFEHGFSRWNNALWTLKIELFGSFAVLLTFMLTSGMPRFAMLVIGSVVLPSLTEPSYIAFGLGAILYEGHRVGMFTRKAEVGWNATVPFVLLLVTGLLLAFPGGGFHDRVGLPHVPPDWRIGGSRGYLHVFAAALVILCLLISPATARPFSSPILLWLGRVSFGLYLVHVPILYTVVAHLHLDTSFGTILIAAIFLAICLALAEIFTRLIDIPTLRLCSRIRSLGTSKG